MDTAQQREVRAAEPLTMTEIVFPSDLNPNGVMFGGKVVALMDIAAGMCGSRWCNRPMVTASIDSIQFCAPIRQGQIIEAVARIFYVGNTSCIIRVEVQAQDILTGDRFYCCDGFFSVVAMDSHSRPAGLPMLPLDTAERQANWDKGKEVKDAMLARKARGRA
jgi:acyl-CoA hydrolase